MQTTRACVLAVALAAAAAGCDTADPTLTATAPSTAVPPTVETFTGTVQPGGSDFKRFTVALTGGTLTITLTAAGPPATVAMGLGVGTPSADGSTCALLAGGALVTPAGAAPQLSGPVNGGPYCVEVFDAGGASALTAPSSYAVTVTHY